MTAVYYFYQYTLRSAPAVMMPQLSDAFGLSALGVASMVGLFYYGYSPFSLVAGVGDGPARAAAGSSRSARPLVGIGALLFAIGQQRGGERRAGSCRARAASSRWSAPSTSRRTNFPASRAATLIGATQMFGMAGGSAGQFVVGPADRARAFRWSTLLDRHGHHRPGDRRRSSSCCSRRREADGAARRLAAGARPARSATVFRNPQSILCGMIAGLLFIPTTIFDMIWGVRYLQEAHGLDYATAVMRSATVPLGWIIGCPLLGFVSDRIGRRKPVIVGGALVLLGLPRLDPVRPAGRACRRTSSASSPASPRAPRCCRTR